jgi:hypothetical protein
MISAYNRNITETRKKIYKGISLIIAALNVCISFVDVVICDSEEVT